MFWHSVTPLSEKQRSQKQEMLLTTWGGLWRRKHFVCMIIKKFALKQKVTHNTEKGRQVSHLATFIGCWIIFWWGVGGCWVWGVSWRRGGKNIICNFMHFMWTVLCVFFLPTFWCPLSLCWCCPFPWWLRNQQRGCTVQHWFHPTKEIY